MGGLQSREHLQLRHVFLNTAYPSDACAVLRPNTSSPSATTPSGWDEMDYDQDRPDNSFNSQPSESSATLYDDLLDNSLYSLLRSETLATTIATEFSPQFHAVDPQCAVVKEQIIVTVYLENIRDGDWFANVKIFFGGHEATLLQIEYLHSSEICQIKAIPKARDLPGYDDICIKLTGTDGNDLNDIVVEKAFQWVLAPTAQSYLEILAFIDAQQQKIEKLEADNHSLTEKNLQLQKFNQIRDVINSLSLKMFIIPSTKMRRIIQFLDGGTFFASPRTFLRLTYVAMRRVAVYNSKLERTDSLRRGDRLIADMQSFRFHSPEEIPRNVEISKAQGSINRAGFLLEAITDEENDSDSRTAVDQKSDIQDDETDKYTERQLAVLHIGESDPIIESMAQLPQHLSVGGQAFVHKVVQGLCTQPGPVWAHVATIINVNHEKYLYQLQWIHQGLNLDDVPGSQAARWFHQENLRAIPATMSTDDIALATLAMPGEVEAILGFRGDAGQLRLYLVKWTGWPLSATTWEP
ncbi:hypothetical protein HDU93_006321, partial [Gonapodya sp. JEL0774]